MILWVEPICFPWLMISEWLLGCLKIIIPQILCKGGSPSVFHPPMSMKDSGIIWNNAWYLLANCLYNLLFDDIVHKMLNLSFFLTNFSKIKWFFGRKGYVNVNVKLLWPSGTDPISYARQQYWSLFLSQSSSMTRNLWEICLSFKIALGGNQCYLIK